MSVLYARCRWVRAAIRDFAGDDGRAVSVYVTDGNNRSLPNGWESWKPWLQDAPDPFLSDLIESSEQLLSVVKNLRGVRTDLASIRSDALRAGFTTFFESWLGRPWLTSIDAGEQACKWSGSNDQPSLCQEWILRAAPAPRPHLKEIVEMAREIVLRNEARNDEIDRAFELIPPAQDFQPKKKGAPMLIDRHPDWLPAIKMVLRMKGESRATKEIISKLNAEYPHLGEHTESRVRSICSNYQNYPWDDSDR